jgi:hypothetical protein
VSQRLSPRKYANWCAFIVSMRAAHQTKVSPKDRT